MKKFWEQLRPGERRWVVLIGCVVFLVMNYFMVWPQFKQWHANSLAIEKAKATIEQCRPEIGRKAQYDRELKNFTAAGGGDVAADDQILNFSTFYRDRAVENGVQIQSDAMRPPHTNDFSIDLLTTLDVVGGEKNLVGFLYSLGSSASQMRVRDMHLHAIEPNRYQLHASLTIIASYQKKLVTPKPSAAKSAVASSPAAPAPVNSQTGPRWTPGDTISYGYPIAKSNKPPGSSNTPPASVNRLPASAARTNANLSTNKPVLPKH